MQLVSPSETHIDQLMSWFPTREALSVWSGPGFRYPFNLDAFKEDLKIDSIKSYVLRSSDKSLLAFGQYYLRLNRCHLGRLVVNPNRRGEAIASHLIEALCRIGKADLNTNSCSLFVLEHNENAIKADEKFGFTLANYPEEIPLDGCLYMIKA